MQRKYKEAAFDNKEDFDNAVSEILSIIVNKRDEIFGFSSSELWNFAVYIFHPNESKLKPVWRRKHDNHPSGDLGRVWGLGQGHIGKAFSNRETIITSDATDPEVAALMGPTQSMVREYDDTVYRSFASVVIGPIDSDAAPIGVFVATSDQEGRFDRANALLLRHAAAELANLIHINEIAPETMLD